MTIDDFIEHVHGPIQHGTVQFTVKKYDGRITHVDATTTNQVKVNDNVQALTIIGTLIKQLQQTIIQSATSQNYTPPNLTFTVMFHKDGQAQRIIVNDFKRESMK